MGFSVLIKDTSTRGQTTNLDVNGQPVQLEQQLPNSSCTSGTFNFKRVMFVFRKFQKQKNLCHEQMVSEKVVDG